MRLKWLFFVFSLSVLIYGGVVAQPPSYQAAMEQLNSRGELYFVFRQPSWNTLEKLAGSVSIDNISNGWVTGWANRKGFTQFLEYNIPYQVVPLKSFQKDDGTTKSFTSLDSIDQWNFYPSYNDYIAIMNAFQSAFPGLCRLYEIGLSINGKKILAVKISDHVGADEPEPTCFLTSSMHGDELTGYVMMLNLIDTLLNGYGKNPLITALINNTAIFINPLANPDGAYYVSDLSVAGAIRGNNNHIDLNRNFPDPADGDHPDGNNWQPENIAMMTFLQQNNFLLSANFHGGAEVVNYPWDTWPRLHPDDDWFYFISRCYADTVHFYAGGSYLTNLDNGITNGYQWYRITGGRQDYVTFFLHGREVTIELSTNKIPSALSLPQYFNFNFHSLLNFIDQCRYGIYGLVSDSISGTPLRAKIFISNHDADSSFIYSNDSGWYYRMIKAGTYNLSFTSSGYQSKTITGINVADFNRIRYDVLLVRDVVPLQQDTVPVLSAGPVPFGSYLMFTIKALEDMTAEVSIYSSNGKKALGACWQVSPGVSNYHLNTADLPPGMYICRVISDNRVLMIKAAKVSD